MTNSEAKARIKHIVRTLLNLGVSETELIKVFSEAFTEISEEINKTC